MKKELLIISLMFLNFSFSQDIGIGFGYESNSSGEDVFESVLIINVDLISAKNNILFGLDLGVGLTGVDENNDYTGIINTNAFSEDFNGHYAYNLFKVGGRVGYELHNNFRIIGSIGLNFLTEYQLRYDEFNILGDNGNYGVATGKSKTTPYVKGTLSYRIGDFATELGYGSTGMAIGLSYFF